VIPTFYEILDQAREWLTDKAGKVFGRKPKPAALPEAAGGGVD